ncbi:glyoxalase [Staphylococcus chromogenes]|uniref:Glyoxalase n=3 Tax=Staphylococcus TaxID=1279 RepID=A0AAE5SYK1_STACR|nr:glyoxalase [Staphylococcus chromogenes]PTF69638.1 glyoxalase [Staphylococcus chromogenes]PTG05225.1 glyoxalase [Staphylococcus chromogenes]PTG11507.1 glyoxalase [Staphylococcus chromogenes]PTG12145.1 glyoxalase [Staphylococcus chromogenes]
MKMKVFGLAHIAIMAENYEETISFYTNLLQFKKSHYWTLEEYHIKEACMLRSLDRQTFIEVFDKHARVPSEGNILKKHDENIHGHVLHFALTVDSIKEVVTHLKKSNVKVLNAYESLSLGQPAVEVINAIIEDPNGEIIELLEPVRF